MGLDCKPMQPHLWQLDSDGFLGRVRAVLPHLDLGAEGLRMGPFGREQSRRMQHLFPAEPRRAAVLVPLVQRPEGLSLLFTLRAEGLPNHPGQVSFPGGRIEPGDSDAAAAALRETHEEVGIAPESVEVLGLMPDHMVISGYRVTPVVGLVDPTVRTCPQPSEVADCFEAPLRHLLDPANRVLRRLQVEGVDCDAFDLPWQRHLIWGATAGIVLCLGELMDRQP